MSTDKKVIVVPKRLSGEKLERIQLPHPRTEELCSYYIDNSTETVLEVVTVDMKGKRSWLGDGWVHSNGSLHMLTPIDPLFIYLTLITQQSQTKDDWKFVDIDSLGLESPFIGKFVKMQGLKQKALDKLCDFRQISEDVCVAKIDVDKVIRWLKNKCAAERMPKVLESYVSEFENDELKEQARIREMTLLVSEYLLPFWNGKLFKEYGGFVKVCDSEKLAAKAASAVIYDAPESYTPGIAPPSKAGSKQEKPKTAKERQLEKAASKSKPITSFFQKKKAD
ncbi:Ribonuclease H2 subunit B [Coemansia sp. RSA 1086]|nr:Ribonuclease H2 subunit B [Coemansia sp. RSA 1086]